MKQYHVTGMSCAACQARVEKAVSAVPGVESCAVSLLTNSMGVDGTVSGCAGCIPEPFVEVYRCWKAGDLDDNGRLNAIDLTLIKRKLISG